MCWLQQKKTKCQKARLKANVVLISFVGFPFDKSVDTTLSLIFVGYVFVDTYITSKFLHFLHFYLNAALKMEKSVHALTEHEAFVRELLALYKERPMLWQQTHPFYRNRTERAKAYEQLVKKTQEYYPEADEDFVRMKIDSMRASFRKERRKVLLSKESFSNLEDIYKPSLWYYDLLLFTAGEEIDNEVNLPEVKKEEVPAVTSTESKNCLKIPAVWNRKHSAILINMYKKNPCLYSAAHPLYKSQRKRNEALKKITEKLIVTTGKCFHVDDVRRKITLLRNQFLHEYKRVKKGENAGKAYESNLWCFEMLGFLKEEFVKQKILSNKKSNLNLRKINGRRNYTLEADGEVNVKKESELTSYQVETSYDLFDTTAKNLAHQLREMTEQQRHIANRIIREVMFHGQMEHLSEKSRLSLNGT